MAPAYALAVTADSPVAYWRLDDPGTTAHDFLGGPDGAYQGTVDASSGLLPGDYDPAVVLDGATGRATAPSVGLSLAATGQLTVEAWVRPAAAAGPGTIASHGTAANGDDYSVWWDGGRVGVTVRTAGGATRASLQTPAGAVPAGVVSHLVVTLDDAAHTVRIYVDGVEVSSSTDTWSGASTGQDTDPLVIGMDSGTSGGNFAGTVDEVAIYPAVLSPGRVAAHYASAQ
jgi:hypothetical protein